MTRIDISVQDMGCEGCERAVQASLMHLDGVRDVKADHVAGRVRVGFDPERIDEQRLHAEIAGAGYTPVEEAVS